MPEKNNKLHFCISPELKKEASEIFESLGIDLATGINIFLKHVVLVGGFPYDVRLSRDAVLGLELISLEKQVQAHVANVIAENKATGLPVARFDPEKGNPYLEYPDGRREYDDISSNHINVDDLDTSKKSTEKDW